MKRFSVFKKIFLIIFLTTTISCQNPPKNDTSNVEEEIAALKSNADREKYLESIFEADQNIRNGESSEILFKYGKKSKELKAFYKKMDSIDKLNLNRVETYLKKFGYPQIDSVSQNANLTPWLVIQHSADIQTRKSNFQVLNEAYKNKNLNANQFDLYLGRTYEIINGTYPRTEGPYNPEEKIARLIKELNLN